MTTSVIIIISIIAFPFVALFIHSAYVYHRDKQFRNNGNGKHCKFYVGDEKRDGIVVYIDKEMATVRDIFTRQLHLVPTSQIYAPWL